MNYDLISDGVEHLYNNSMHEEANAINEALEEAMSHNTIAQTKQFMQAAGQTVREKPGQPTPEELKLRLSLELEELYEKAEAFGLEYTFQKMMFGKCPVNETGGMYPPGFWGTSPDTGIYDPVAVLDACADQRVVADGTILACGLAAAFPEAMAEISRSNMSKFPATKQEALDTVLDYAGKDIAADAVIPEGQTRYVVRRQSDGKVLKSVRYSPTNLSPILAKYSG